MTYYYVVKVKKETWLFKEREELEDFLFSDWDLDGYVRISYEIVTNND